MTLLIGARLFVQQITGRAEKNSCVEVFGFFFLKDLLSTCIIVKCSDTLQKWHAMDVVF